MNRRGFLGALLGAALAPKTMLAPAAPDPWAFVGGRVDAVRTGKGIYRIDLKSAYPKNIMIKLQCNSLYGKFAA